MWCCWIFPAHNFHSFYDSSVFHEPNCLLASGAAIVE